MERRDVFGAEWFHGNYLVQHTFLSCDGSFYALERKQRRRSEGAIPIVASTDKHSVLGDKMKVFVIVYAFVVCSSFGLAQNEGSKTLREIKKWQLSTPHGDVSLKLSSAPNGSDRHTVLSLEPIGDFKPTTSEEAELLGRVLHEMSSLQYDPSQLEMISTWLQNSELQEGVANAVFHSGKWRSCAGRKYCYQAEGVANQFLTSVGAFKEFDTILHEYGLRRKVVRVDDLAVGEKAGQILCQGMIVISIEKKK